jgi:hypothetical protein
VSIISFPNKSNDSVVLDDLARRVRTAHAAVLAAKSAAQTSEANALASALIAGAALLEIKAQIIGTMKAWVAKNLSSVGYSTTKLYLQLAAPDNRAAIKAAQEKDPGLSIRAARRLIAKKLAKPKDVPLGTDEVTAAAPAITDAELVAALVERGPDWLVNNMPSAWCAWFQDRLRGQVLRVEAAKHPNVKLKNALRLVHSADQPTTHH